MSLRPRLVDFDVTWTKILETLQSVVTLKKIARAVWNDRFSYLNTHLKKHKQDYGEMSPYSISFCPDSGEEVMDVGALALDIWKRKMIEPLKETLVEHVLMEVKKDRNGEDTHQNVIHDTVLSFVEVQQFQSKGLLHLYEEVLEKPLLKETKSYYRREAAELHADNTSHAFIAKIDVRIQDEDLRARKFFHYVSFSRVLRECEARLVEDYIPYLQGECRQMIKDENRTGLQSIKAVKVENGPQQYVDELLNIHRKFSGLIRETFRDDPAFISALDKACATIVNYRHDPRRSSKSPELIIIFKYIDDKDIFQKFYSKMLAKRLIHTLSVSMDAEEGMIARLKHACGYEYTNKLHRMFTDISISSDLNSSFSDFLSQANSSLGFEKFYNGRFNGRKLTWLQHLSTGEVKVNFLKRPYIITVTTFQMAVMLLFNDKTSLNFSDIRDQTQLVDKELIRTLQSLVDVQLITMPENSDPMKCAYSLNQDFSSKRTKLKITTAVQRESQQDTEQTLSSVDEDRKMYLQVRNTVSPVAQSSTSASYVS
ncbi:Cullin-2 [Acropora cervicornis]|uniref:Cullin-2 n=1 Tax=Acropora cervicornis TaxID=6130 RepID=A0AAD9QH19_ACRCE|nr:Cullin-2 [Acropora cervicornis]